MCCTFLVEDTAGTVTYYCQEAGYEGGHDVKLDDWVKRLKLATNAYYTLCRERPDKSFRLLELWNPCRQHTLAENGEAVDPTRACPFMLARFGVGDLSKLVPEHGDPHTSEAFELARRKWPSE